MASFIRKTFILAVSLMCFILPDVALATSPLRQPRDTGHTIVSGMPVAKNAQVPQRMDFRTFCKNPTYLNIYYLGLLGLQAVDQSSPLSFYQISGIHGADFPWDGNYGTSDQSTEYGFCQHADRRFPTWHRPYICLYEKAVADCAASAIKTFPAGAVKSAHEAAMNMWRLPYWDWASDATVPDLIGKTRNVVVMTAQNGKMKNMTMRNPIYSCPLDDQDLNTMAGGDPDSGPYTKQTVRNPGVQNNEFVSQPSISNRQMTQSASSLRSQAYNSLTVPTDYNSFSNMDDDYYSVEYCHGAVHTLLGGDDGHMTYPNTAAYDPVFYMHHCNVDRLFAIWQAINPNSYISNRSSDYPNQDTPLYPFRYSDNKYWTSKLARDTKSCGYTYPELANNPSRAAVIAAVNKMYGSSSSTKKQKRDLSPSNNYPTGEDLGNSGVAATTPETRNEYLIHIKASNCHEHGSYRMHFFLGDPPSDEYDHNYEMDPNWVGTYRVFARKKLPKSRKKLVKGMVCMTDALEKRVATGELKDMTPKNVKAYLKTYLKWIVKARWEGGFDYDGWEMTVVTAPVTSPKDEYSLPTWGKFSPIYKAV